MRLNFKVEYALPNFIRRRLMLGKETLNPNKQGSRITKLLPKLYITPMEEIIKELESDNADHVSVMVEGQQELKTKLRSVREAIKEVSQDVETNRHILLKLARKHRIRHLEEEYFDMLR